MTGDLLGTAACRLRLDEQTQLETVIEQLSHVGAERQSPACPCSTIQAAADAAQPSLTSSFIGRPSGVDVGRSHRRRRY
jgi:hypothetical protein